MRTRVRKQLRRLLSVCLAFCVCAVNTIPAIGEETAASTMKLSATEGMVAVTNKNGKFVSVIQGMRLYNGYRLITEAESYAYISLDSVKALKLDAVSKAEVRQKGKQLEVLLEEGNLFFDVKAPLKEEETLNIRTSTMVTGIRGTSGWVKKIDENTSRLYVLEGQVQCSVTNPVTGKVEEITLLSGQTATFTVDKNGDVTVTLGIFTEEEVEGFVAMAIKNDAALQQKLTQDGIFNVPLIISKAEESLENDQLLTNDRLADVANQLAGQNAGKTVSDVFQDSQDDSDSDDTEGNSNTGSTEESPTESAEESPTPNPTESTEESATPNPTESTEESATPNPTESTEESATPNPTESTEESATPNPTESTEESATPNPTESTEESATPNPTESTAETPGDVTRQMVQRNMPISAAALNTLLQTSDVTLSSTSGADTLLIDSNVTVPAGGILNVGNGIAVNVNADQTLQVDGSLTVEESVVNSGIINNTSELTFIIKKGFSNSGQLTNTGRIVVTDNLNNSGIFKNKKTLEAKAQINNTGGTMELGGTVSGNIDSAAPLTVSGAVTGNLSSRAALTVPGTITGNVTSEAEFTLTGTVDGTVTSNAKFTSSGTVTGRVTSNGEMSISDGSVWGISQESNVLTLTGGVVGNGVTLGDTGKLTLTAGTVNKGANEAAVLYNLWTGEPEVELRGGTVDGKDGVAVLMARGRLSIYDTVIKAQDVSNMIKNVTPGPAEYGVQFFYQNSAGELGEGNLGFIPICTSDNDGYSMVGLSFDLLPALTEAAGGKTVVLKEDYILGDYTDGSMDDIVFITTSAANPPVLDLNGKKLTLEANLTLSVGSDTDAGGIKIKNSQMAGGMDMRPGSNISIKQNSVLELDEIALEMLSSDIGRTPIENSNGTLKVSGTKIVSNITQISTSERLLTMNNGTASFINSSIMCNGTSSGGSSPGPVIFAEASESSCTLLINNTSIEKKTPGSVIDVYPNTEITIGEGTEIIGTADAAGVLSLYNFAQDIKVNYKGGLIRNNAEQGFAVLYGAAAEIPAPGQMMTTLQRKNMGALLLINYQEVTPDGYTVEFNQSSGYYELTAANRIATYSNAYKDGILKNTSVRQPGLIPASSSDANINNEKTRTNQLPKSAPAKPEKTMAGLPDSGSGKDEKKEGEME